MLRPNWSEKNRWTVVFFHGSKKLNLFLYNKEDCPESPSQVLDISMDRSNIAHYEFEDSKEVRGLIDILKEYAEMLEKEEA